MKWGVIVFPGSNCDHDAYDSLKRILGQQVKFVWHKENILGDVDGVILPGGFAHGDYLRAGAIARFSPIVEDVIRFANDNGTVIGICNGFQVLTEAGLLPGALRQNVHRRFICEDRYIRVEHNKSRFTAECENSEVLQIPVAHNEGNYYVAADKLKEMEDNQQILFRYCSKQGEVTEKENPNGSLNNIAGICNANGNVLGMMPHPERRCDPLIGGIDGRKIFESVIKGN